MLSTHRDEREARAPPPNSYRIDRIDCPRRYELWHPCLQLNRREKDRLGSRTALKATPPASPVTLRSLHLRLTARPWWNFLIAVCRCHPQRCSSDMERFVVISGCSGGGKSTLLME